MTYSTPAYLLKAGQGVSCLFFFFLGALDSAEAPFDNPETLDDTTGPALFRPEASISLFLALNCPSYLFFLLHSCSILFHIALFTSDI